MRPRRILISQLILDAFKGEPEELKTITARSFGFEMERPWSERYDHHLDCIVLEQEQEENQVGEDVELI